MTDESAADLRLAVQSLIKGMDMAEGMESGKATALVTGVAYAPEPDACDKCQGENGHPLGRIHPKATVFVVTKANADRDEMTPHRMCMQCLEIMRRSSCMQIIDRPDITKLRPGPDLLLVHVEGDRYAVAQPSRRLTQTDDGSYRIPWVIRLVSPPMSYTEALALADKLDAELEEDMKAAIAREMKRSAEQEANKITTSESLLADLDKIAKEAIAGIGDEPTLKPKDDAAQKEPKKAPLETGIGVAGKKPAVWQKAANDPDKLA